MLLSSEHWSLAGLERAAERLDDGERVLPLEPAVEVEGEEEYEPFGQSEALTGKRVELRRAARCRPGT